MVRSLGEPNGEKWQEWKERAAEEVLAALDTPNYIITDLYKQCRDDIFKHFHDKCAYCQASVKANVLHQPDVDHYRPAGKLKDYPSKKFVSNANGTVHPGYFWLAYNWTNLLPACVACNRPGGQGKGGKWSYFPIEGARAFTPADNIDLEEPLLLNPYVDEPNDHLRFDVRNGLVGGKTRRGDTTVKLLDLNRDGLIYYRKQVILTVRFAIVQWFSAWSYGQTHVEQALADMVAQASPDLEFSALRRAVLDHGVPPLQAE